VSYHIDHCVGSRVAKNFYGIKANFLYTYTHWPFLYLDSDPEHISRRNSMYTDLDGYKRISGSFSIILSRVRNPASLLSLTLHLVLLQFQGTRVSETQEFRKSYIRTRKSENDPFLNVIHEDIQCYRGLRKHPKWFDEEPSKFRLRSYDFAQRHCQICILFSAMSKLTSRIFQNMRKPPWWIRVTTIKSISMLSCRWVWQRSKHTLHGKKM